MKSDFIFYEFSRAKVERLDYSHFLNRFALDKLPVGRGLRDMMGKMAFCIHGYDEEPRELHMIPEVLRFYKTFSTLWPFWLYFCELHAGSLRVMTLCCLASLTTMQVDGSTECAVELDRKELAAFVDSQLKPTGEIFQRASLHPEKRLFEVLEYFGLSYEK